MHNRFSFFLAGNCSKIPFPLDNVCQLHVPRFFWTELEKKSGSNESNINILVDSMSLLSGLILNSSYIHIHVLMYIV